MLDEAAQQRPDALGDEDLVAELAGRQEELRIVIHDLEVSRPPMWTGLLALGVSLILLLGSLLLISAPYFRAGFPEAISTVAAFTAVILSFVSYLALRRFSAQYEHIRLHNTVLKRATYLNQVANNLLKETSGLSYPSEAALNDR